MNFTTGGEWAVHSLLNRLLLFKFYDYFSKVKLFTSIEAGPLDDDRFLT